MKIDILTLFPNMFEGFINESIIKRAINKGLVSINVIDFRKYSKLNNNQVDDTPYGGGGGMVLRIEPLYDAIMDAKKDSPDAKVILMTPDGVQYKQNMAVELSKGKHLIFVCGHYEGFDERIRTLCDMEISIGDYVLTGGELPAMVISDSIIRLLDGVITNTSLDSESFNDKLLDYPTYTKPQEFMGMKVPDVLISGNHENIKAWRNEMRLKRTQERRPDLLD
ncbi:MAG: tRNA (guanosine(37)-N1)-methyltransferase TrmD [Candidatus Coprovivens sp.]